MIDIIANVGYNWYSKEDSLARAKELTEACVRAGANMINVPILDPEMVYRDINAAKTLAHFAIPKDVLLAIQDMTRTAIDRKFLVTPRTIDAVALGEEIKVDGYLIQQGDITHQPLLQAVANTGKHIYLSTAFAFMEEISQAVETIAEIDVDYMIDHDDHGRLVLLHSNGGAPHPVEQVNLQRILSLMEEFMPLYVGLEAMYRTTFLDFVAMGYPHLDCVVRRVDLADKQGVEAEYSITPSELETLVMMSAIMIDINDPDIVSGEFTETDFLARKNMLRVAGCDYLVPPNKCV